MMSSTYLRLLGFVLALFVVSPFLRAASSADSHCSRTLLQYSSHENLKRYMLRGHRCEGLYGKPKRSTLRLVSFVDSAGGGEVDKDGRLLLSWWAPPQYYVRLRAYAFPPPYDDSYQMDSFRTPGTGEFSWPFDIINSLKLGVEDLGMIGWYRLPVAGGEHDVYTPLKVGRAPPTTKERSYTVTFLPGAELRDVSYDLAWLGAHDDFRPDRVSEPKRFANSFCSDCPIVLQISGFDHDGIYELTLGGIGMDSGVPTATKVWILHQSR